MFLYSRSMKYLCDHFQDVLAQCFFVLFWFFYNNSTCQLGSWSKKFISDFAWKQKWTLKLLLEVFQTCVRFRRTNFDSASSLMTCAEPATLTFIYESSFRPCERRWFKKLKGFLCGGGHFISHRHSREISEKRWAITCNKGTQSNAKQGHWWFMVGTSTQWWRFSAVFFQGMVRGFYI